MRTTNCFPIYRQQLSLGQCMQMLYPTQKTGLNLRCIQQCKDPTKGIMRWYAMLQPQHLFQPLLLGPPKFLYFYPAVRSADDCTYRYHDDIA